MSFVFSPFTPVPAVFDASGLALVRQCKGWDWSIPFSLQDGSGALLDLAGNVTAQLLPAFSSTPISLAVTDVGSGLYKTKVLSAVTGTITAQTDYASAFPTRVVIAVQDADGLIAPVRIILIHVLDPHSTTLLSLVQS